jgi:heat shock protein HslJ
MEKRFKSLAALVVIIVVVGSFAFSSQKKAPQETGENQVVVYQNTLPESQYQQARAEYMGEQVVVSVDGSETITLSSIESASGAKYANEDGSVVFWEQAGEAMIIVDGETVVFQGMKQETVEGAPDVSQQTTSATYVWVESVIGGDARVAPLKPDVFTITFDNEGNVSGTTDCNSFGGSYVTAEDGTITFSEFTSTLMFCEGSQETEFLGMLQEVDTIAFDENGSVILSWDGEAGAMLFAPKM